MQEASYLIIGGGPAGLTMARMLKDQGVKKVTILEASPKVGGKCLSSDLNGHVVEFGTCYAIWSHRYILKHMKRLGIKRNYFRAQRIDDRDLLDYIRAGDGPPFVAQVVKYAWLRWRIMARASKGDPAINSVLSQKTHSWLRANNLGKIERMMHRVVTSIGYGYLDRVPLVHAMRWVDIDMLITGLIKFTVMPDGGWQHFWDRFADALDVRLDHKVQNVTRLGSRVEVMTENGASFQADYLVNTLPLDEFNQLTQPTVSEARVADAITWSGYTTTLLSVEAWKHTAPVNAWSDTCANDAKDGELLYSRFECDDPDGKRVLYSVGQSSAQYTPEELRELVLFSAGERGASDPKVMQQVIWKYMPTYAAEQIQSGLLQVMMQMQGEKRTFHTGASFSHEAVSTISTFNARLLATAMA